MFPYDTNLLAMINNAYYCKGKDTIIVHNTKMRINVFNVYIYQNKKMRKVNTIFTITSFGYINSNF